MKKVIYNGGTETCYPCSSPEGLIKGDVYVVTNETVYDWHTDYTLLGIPGKFNSVWFNPVASPSRVAKKSKIVFTRKIPEIGNLIVGFRLQDSDFVSWRTTPVISITQLDTNLFLAETCNTSYYVEVLTQ